MSNQDPKPQLTVSYLVYSSDDLILVAEEQTLLWTKLFYQGHNLQTAYGGSREEYLEKIQSSDQAIVIPIQLYVGGSRDAEFRLARVGSQTYLVSYIFEEWEEASIEKQSMLTFLKSIYSVYNFPVGTSTYEPDDNALTLFNSDNFDVKQLNPEEIILHPHNYHFDYCIVNSDFFAYYNYDLGSDSVAVTGILIKNT